MPAEKLQHAIEPLTRLYLQSLNSHISDAFDCAPFATLDSWIHTRDDSSGTDPDKNDQDGFDNIVFDSVVVSDGVTCWSYTHFCPRHSCEPADTKEPNNTFEVSLIGDYNDK